jgi:ferric-dicitrate binding protein FerR (iron transport regulator)
MTMSNHRENPDMKTDEALETLLSQATVRPAPGADAEATVRRTVQAEWQGMVRTRKRRARAVRFAMAATFLLAAFVAIDAFRGTVVPAAHVADIDRSHGPVYLLGERSELHETPDLTSVVAGQTVVTGKGAGIGFAMVSGTSVRLDQGVRVEFIDTQTVHLHSGRIYVDSRPAQSADHPSGGLLVRTNHGDVRHLGTQFIAQVEDRLLAVSVREGKVAIDGRFHDATVSTGQLVSIRGSQRPSVANVPRFGEHWKWAEAMAPSADFDGRSVKDFLEWVSRETGLSLEFESSRAEQLARDENLNGEIDSPPMNALRVWMMGVDLDWRIDDGVILISETDH